MTALDIPVVHTSLPFASIDPQPMMTVAFEPLRVPGIGPLSASMPRLDLNCAKITSLLCRIARNKLYTKSIALYDRRSKVAARRPWL